MKSNKVSVYARVHRNLNHQAPGAKQLVHMRDRRTVSVLLQRHGEGSDEGGGSAPKGSQVKRGSDGATYETFAFARVLDHDATQADVYESLGADLVRAFCSEANQLSYSVFAYGQTGSGKTYSMTGGETYEKRGLIPRALSSVLECLKLRHNGGRPTIYLSYCEIYEEKLRDLLYPRSRGGSQGEKSKQFSKQRMRANSRPCREKKVHTEEAALEVFFKGNANRVTSGTVGNSFSSRSHCVFSIRIEGSKARLNFVDLAGSERWTIDKDRETRSINLSLHYLEQVVLQMTEQSPRHINFRNCTITRLLQDSFSGNSRTVFLMTLQENSCSSRESLSTCRFAVRCQKLNILRHHDWLGQKQVGLLSRRAGDHREIKRLTEENERLEQELTLVKETFKKKEMEIMHLLDLIDPIEDMLTHGQYFTRVKFKGTTTPKLHLWVSPCFSALHIGSPRRVLDLSTLQKVVCAPIREEHPEVPQDTNDSEAEQLWEVLFISKNVIILQFEVAEPWVPCFESLLAKFKQYNSVRQRRKHERSLDLHVPAGWSLAQMKEKLHTRLHLGKTRARTIDEDNDRVG